MDVNPGQVDLVRVKLTGPEQLLYLGDADLAGTG